MGKAKKVVLAYSGGVDTSVCIPYLKKEYGVEHVIAFAADLGQGDELEEIEATKKTRNSPRAPIVPLARPLIVNGCVCITH